MPVSLVQFGSSRHSHSPFTSIPDVSHPYDYRSFVPAGIAFRACDKAMTFGGSVTWDEAADIVYAFRDALCQAELVQDGSRLEEALRWTDTADLITSLMSRAHECHTDGDLERVDQCFDFARQLAPHWLFMSCAGRPKQPCLPLVRLS